MNAEKVKLPQDPIPMRSVHIPPELLREFKTEPMRIVRDVGSNGILILPDNILRNFELLSKLRDEYDVVLVPKLQEVEER